MAIVCEEYDLLFTHVPKTGGVFVQRMLTRQLEGRKVGERHASFRRLALSDPPGVRVFVVREPLSWYRSYWAFAQQATRKRSAWPTWGHGRGTHPTNRLDIACASRTFEGFIQKALRAFPNGFVRSMYCDFLNGATHALRTSHLSTDLEALLRLVEYDRPSLVRDRRPENTTDPKWKAAATLSPELERRIQEVDHLDGLRIPYLVR